MHDTTFKRACLTGRRIHWIAVFLSTLGLNPALADGDGDPRVKVPHAQRTIALKMPAFRRCFEAMNATGRVSIVMTVVSDGAVSRAQVDGSVPRPVVECIRSQALATVFSEPEGGHTARLSVPVSFIRQYG